MGKKVPVFLPNDASRIYLCIDSAAHAELQGRWYNPYRPAPVSFENVITLLGSMEAFYNALCFPQSTFATRHFKPGRLKNTGQSAPRQREVKRYMSDEALQQLQGDKATFVVQVQFRQNATWQGTVTWAEKNETCHFRSALELLKLMDETLGQAGQMGETTAI